MKIQFTLIALVALVGGVAAQPVSNPNPFAKPAVGPSPTQQSPLSGGNQPTQHPFPVSQGTNLPPPGYSPTPPSSLTEETEEVPAVRIGRVNGKDIYRGTETYLFMPKDKNVKVTRKPVKQGSQSNVVAADPNLNTQNRGNLPSMVGRPAPRN